MAKLFLQKPGLAPTMFATVIVVVTAWLGVWQIERMTWKNGVIAMIKTRTVAAPVALPAFVADPTAWNYRRVSFSGTYSHGQESYLQAQSTDGEFGYQVITPLRRADGSVVMVNRGWVPYGKRDPSTRLAGQVAGEVSVSGIVRLPWYRRSWVRQYIVENDPVDKLYYEGALPEMAAAYGLEVAPFFVDADDNANPGGLPRGGQTVMNIRNMHLGYVITWFSLSAIALVIFVLYHRKREED